jgi:small-conductance mechanosensitive channel
MLDDLTQLAEKSFYGNALTDWGVALVAAVAALVALFIVRVVIAARLRTLAERFHLMWPAHVLKAVSGTNSLVLLVFSLCAGAVFLDLPDKAETWLSRAFAFALFVQAGLWIMAMYESWYEDYRSRFLVRNPSAVTTMGAVRFILSIVIWICILLLVLDNLGFDVTALIAGLGIGGVAVALAVQNILGDLLASLSIIMDKPFVVGDFLALGEHMGTVENIGLKATRLRSLSGEQLVFSNSDLLSSRIRNYGRMYERRVVNTLSVKYSTPLEKLQSIPAMLRQAIETKQKTRFDRAHFKAHGMFSLDFEYVYYVTTADYNLYMDIQQAISFELHHRFAEEGIEFAYQIQPILSEKKIA